MSIYTDLGVGEALTKLAVARGGLLDDVTAEVYLDRLERFDPLLVARACEHWSDVARQPYEAVLPEVGKLIETVKRLASEDAAKVAAAKLLPLPKSENDEPRFFCLECRDEPAAFRVYTCPGVGKWIGPSAGLRDSRETASVCARRQDHAPHSYVEKCACSDFNPNIAAHRRRIREAHDRRQQAKKQ